MCCVVLGLLLMLTCQVPADVYSQEMPGIYAKFLKKYGDSDLEEAITNGDGPLDVAQLSIFAHAMTKQQKAVEARMIEKNKDLAHRVAQATLDEMLSHIESDSQSIRDYTKNMTQTRRSQELAQKTHQEQRYQRGLVRVEEQMEALCQVHCAEPAAFPQVLALMQNNANKSRTTSSRNTMVPKLPAAPSTSLIGDAAENVFTSHPAPR